MSEADRPRTVEEGDGPGVTPGDLNPGDRPRRRRGYYRAVKRGEKWAVEISKKRGWSWCLGMYFMHIAWGKELKNRPVFDLLEKSEPWTGASLVVPFTDATSPPRSKTRD